MAVAPPVVAVAHKPIVAQQMAAPTSAEVAPLNATVGLGPIGVAIGYDLVSDCTF